MPSQAQKMEAKYQSLIGINQFGDGEATDELQFWNYGFWLDGVDDPKIASVNLLDQLVSMLPPPPARILDVAFGQGGSLKRLCEIYGVENVVGINIAANQVNHARSAGIECEIHVMDAAQMSFEDASFDGILCIEAAFHFRTRSSFLNDANRILRKGGSLVISDFILRSGIGLDNDLFPPENIVMSIDEYSQVFLKSGFSPDNTEIILTSDKQLVPFLARMSEFAGYLPAPNPTAINIQAQHSQDAIHFILTRLINIADTVIVAANRD